MSVSRAAAALTLAVALAGCKDYGACLASHPERFQYVQMIPAGYINGAPNYIYLPAEGMREACDRWEFPEGKP